MLSTIYFIIFCLLSRNRKLKYKKLIFCLMFCMDVNLGLMMDGSVRDQDPDENTWT